MQRIFSVVSFALTLAFLSFPAVTTRADAPGLAAFAEVWERTDKPVADLVTGRTWVWGPLANTPVMDEPYAEAPGGQRQVQYFDKSRMELTDPNGDPNSPWYVTNGLLVVELISGRIQTGDGSFEDHGPAWIPVAGDADDIDAPMYAGMTVMLTQPPAVIGETLINELEWFGGSPSNPRVLGWHANPAFEGYGVTAAVHVPETNHTVASVFWEFMNSSGVVYENGQFVTAPLFLNAFYATGFPITEANWATVKVGGVYKDVLLQCFERRCLTYTPGNPEGWQVEAGNVGQHYYQWRYGNDEPSGPDAHTVAFVSDETGNNDVYTIQADGAGLANLTEHPADDRAFDWSPDGSRIAFVSDRDGDDEIYTMAADGSDLRQLTHNEAIADSEPVWSPDGSQLAFTTSRDGDQEIYLMAADGSNPTNFSQYSDAGEWEPRWSPDGSRIAYRSGRTDIVGRFATILIAEVAAPEQPVGVGCGSEQRYGAQWSPDGNALAYYAKTYQGAAFSICVVDRDGQLIDELTYGDLDLALNTDAGNLAWTPDGALTFNALRVLAPGDESAGIYAFDPTNDGLDLIVELGVGGLPAYTLIDWSADGARLAIAGAGCPSDGGICLYEVGADMPNQLTELNASEVQWRPDSAML